MGISIFCFYFENRASSLRAMILTHPESVIFGRRGISNEVVIARKIFDALRPIYFGSMAQN